MEKNLTTGSVFKNLLFFSLPYLLSYFLQTLYGMADLFIIGQFEGVSSTTAISIGSQVMHMLTVMIVGLAMGSTVLIGQAVGAGDKKKSASAIGNTTVLFLGLSVVLAGLLLLAVRPITAVMSTPAEAVEGTVRYLTICFIGIPFVTAYNVLSSIFRGLGDSKSPMYLIAAACAANIVLDLIFMGPLHLGPSGAALGTTISQAFSVLLALLMIRKHKNGLTLTSRDFRPARPILGRILSVGVPIALQDGFIQISFILITIIANQRGLNDAAAVGIVEKVISFLFLVPSSMLSAVSALAAQNIGAGKQGRAKATLKYAICIAVGFGAVCTLVIQVTAPAVVTLFTDASTANGAAVIRLGSQYMRGYVLDCLFAGIHFCFCGYFCAIGKSGISFFQNLMSILLMRVPGAWLASTLFPDTLLPMGLATAAGSLLSVFICVTAFLLLSRKEKPAAA